jgi:hypothetical protein
MKPVSLLYGQVLLIILFTMQTAFGQCTKDVDCKGDRVCVNGECVEPVKSTTGPASGSSETLDNSGSAGWAFGAAIAGYACTPIILGLGISSAATTGGDASLPLGISAFTVGVVALPIIAVGGASARSHSKARGTLGIRIPGYITYGLALANGAVLVGLGIAGATISPAPIITCTLFGATGCALMATDALISSGQAKRGYAQGAEEPGMLRLCIVPKRRGGGMRVDYLF